MSNGLLQYEYFSSVTQHRKNELGIQKSFDELRQAKTSLVIAHRLSTIQQADQIIIMENGNILAIANSIDQHVRVRKIDKRELSAFNLEGYQVVRNQFTQVRYEGPSITISDDRITFNIFCIIISPKCTGSIPKDTATGRSIGVRTVSAAIVSIKQPTISKIRFISRRASAFVLTFSIKKSVNIWGTCSIVSI